MKPNPLLIILLLIVATTTARAQSKSFDTLRDHFKGTEDVHSISVGGFFCRTVLWMAGEEEFRDAIKELNHIRMITIPKENFRAQHLSVNGFRKVLKSDGFESLATVKDDGEYFEIYLQQNDNKQNRYFVLVEDEDEIIGIELKGEIDIQKLASSKKEVVYHNL